jgi:integrase
VFVNALWIVFIWLTVSKTAALVRTFSGEKSTSRCSSAILTSSGRTGLMLQTLLETGVRASELVLPRVEDVSLIERGITIRQGKGGKRREMPIRRDLAQAAAAAYRHAATPRSRVFGYHPRSCGSANQKPATSSYRRVDDGGYMRDELFPAVG